MWISLCGLSCNLPQTKNPGRDFLPHHKECYNSSMNRDKGFTLIELLVVIAIIALLSSVVIASLSTARAKSRDARRLADISQVRTALELYYDSNQGYPSTTGAQIWRSECSGWGTYANNNVIPGLVPTYMSRIPTDPEMNVLNSTCCNIYSSDGINYKYLSPRLCPSVNFSSRPEYLDPFRDGGASTTIFDGTAYFSWQISSEGGKFW